MGTTLAEKYALKQLLGVGGMAAVFEAENTWTGRRVAIKLLTADLDGDDEEEKTARFMQEARAATRVEHPNIVQILDMGRDAQDGSLFIVEEYLTGQDLRALLDGRKKLAVRSALEIMIPVMDALREAHTLGIVHRDIKPANIFLARNANGEIQPKVIDFGVVKMASSDGITKTGTTIGTPEYMSPEQAHGDKTIDQQTDVWSTAVVLWEMIAGRCPYENENYHALLVKIVWEETPRLEKWVPDLPRGFADVLHKALQRDRSQRYPDMRAFLDAVLGCASLKNEPWMQALAGAYAPKRSMPGMNEVTGFISVPSRPPPPMISPPADIDRTTALFAPPNAETMEIDALDLATSTGPSSAARELDGRPSPTPSPTKRSSSRVTKKGLAISLALGLAGAIGAALAMRTPTAPAPHATVPLATPSPPIVIAPAVSPDVAVVAPSVNPIVEALDGNGLTVEPLDASAATDDAGAVGENVADADAVADADDPNAVSPPPDLVIPADETMPPEPVAHPVRRGGRNNRRHPARTGTSSRTNRTRNGAPILGVP